MSSKLRLGAIILGLAIVVAGLYYVFTAPFNYQRLPGVRIGGTQVEAPADWNSIAGEGVVYLKLGGFPPVVVKVFYATDDDGIITATRPDNGYWARRVRENPTGWIRIGDNTYELQAREVMGDERLPMLEKYGAANRMPMRYDFEGEIVVGSNEPLYTWEVFHWTPRT